MDEYLDNEEDWQDPDEEYPRGGDDE